MAVLPMKRVRICALKKNRKQILEILQRQGVVEISDSRIEEDSVFKKTDMTSAKTVFEKNAAVARQGLEVLDSIAPEKKPMLAMLEGRKELTVEEYEVFGAERDEIVRVAYHLTGLAKQIAENRAAIPKLEMQIEALAPWLTLDIPVDFKGTKKTTAFIGTFAGGTTQQQIFEELALHAPLVNGVNVDIVSISKEQTCIFAVCPKEDAATLEDALRKTGFARPPVSGSTAPALRKVELEQEITALKAEIAAAEAEIATYVGARNALRFTIDYYTLRAEKYEIIGKLAQSRRVFILSGFIAEREAAQLEACLGAKLDVAIEFETPEEQEDIPVALKNSAFAAPVESVVESYSLPGRGELDPTSVMACFYYALFGLMLSDAAYGLIMVGICGFCLWKVKSIEPGMKSFLKMFLYCGISTTFWGFMFGSFFGDAIAVVSNTFFHVDFALKPIWFEPVKEPMRMLVFSFAIGILHLFTGLATKLYQCVKKGEYLDALYDVIFWYMLVGGGIVYLLTMQMFTDMMGLAFILPPIVGTIATISAIIGAIGIVLTSGRESRNWGKRLLKGLYGLYNVTGYLSDILSYSRLLALGLATGVIATVFNKMGSMGGDGIVGAIMFVLVFVIGHSLNIGINLLGAYVHTNRLQFVEFFGKFYEGGGRKFSPFTENTKYYKIKEDI